MKITVYKSHTELQKANQLLAYQRFVLNHLEGNFFQSLYYLELFENLTGFDPILLIANDKAGNIMGSLLGVFQTNGSNIKSWLSRRLIINGGPLISEKNPILFETLTKRLLSKLESYASGQAIYIEFRNCFDTHPMENSFKELEFTYEPHLNFLVQTDEIANVKKRMSKSKWRQIKSSLKAGAKIVEASSEKEVEDFYAILKDLYETKVKKPLPTLPFFLKIQASQHVKIFLIKMNESVIGGIVCPIFDDRIIYEWYICGKSINVKNVYPSVLATWAPIEFAINNNYKYFDFMGAGKPSVDYGVREFKSRFGGEQVAHGRYNLVLNKVLYNVGKLGLKVYQKIR